VEEKSVAEMNLFAQNAQKNPGFTKEKPGF
jgi:hypothetical protein